MGENTLDNCGQWTGKRVFKAPLGAMFANWDREKGFVSPQIGGDSSS